MATYSNDHHLSGLSPYFLEFEDGDEMVMSSDDFLALTSNGMVVFSIYGACGHEHVYNDNNPEFQAHDTQDENWWRKFAASLLVCKEGISYNQMVKDKCKSFIQGLQALDSSCVSLDDLLGLSLLIDVPRNMNPGKRPKKKQHDISSPDEYHDNYQCVYELPRARLMAYCDQYLCRKDHYSMGRSGVKELKERHHREIRSLSTDRDWGYSNAKPSIFYSKDVNLGILAKINVVSLKTVTEVI